ncbi:hypothetical protein M011DRAFT_470348 [Sporormia fimetaria CBS 119925]|uniref:Uncharacterized protein n=1 Tax=Sporormia fimetaria CBS 119925 TaxID=1340428 RepID=A0A6A6V3S1_9PLEO|nr:hypothetical protein M011DRAFT_470348 [Sporormia fimetaria CBS 119925]
MSISALAVFWRDSARPPPDTDEVEMPMPPSRPFQSRPGVYEGFRPANPPKNPSLYGASFGAPGFGHDVQIDWDRQTTVHQRKPVPLPTPRVADFHVYRDPQQAPTLGRDSWKTTHPIRQAEKSEGLDDAHRFRSSRRGHRPLMDAAFELAERLQDLRIQESEQKDVVGALALAERLANMQIRGPENHALDPVALEITDRLGKLKIHGSDPGDIEGVLTLAERLDVLQIHGTERKQD